jgi:eukaryotic-like serine/threonine-protein kinase
MASTVLSGRYELGRVLGRGGMAEVREARDVVLGRRVAVKILHPALAEDPAVIERFRREATTLAALNHPDLVGIYDAGSDGDSRYLVMEYLEGRTLADVLREDGALDPATALAVGARAASALEAVHRAGLVHRDVKPANIMITPDGGVKLMDLGIARAADTTALTAASMVVGTAAYFSPEQAQGRAADARSDIYSLGCVVYEMVTGRRPFEADSPVAMALQHVNAQPDAPSALVADLPDGFDAVLARALAKDPDLRHPSAAELARELERLGAGEPVAAAPVGASAATQAMTAPAPATAVQPVTAPVEPAGPAPRRGVHPATWLLATLVAVAALAVLAAATGLFDTDDDAGDETAVDVEDTDAGDGTEVPEEPEDPEPPGTEDTTTTTEAETTTTTEAATDFGPVDRAAAAVGTEADQALADGEIDQSARDNLAGKAADAAAKARDGDDDALDQVASLRDDLDALRDGGDLTPPTYDRLRRAVDDLEAAITAVL